MVGIRINLPENTGWIQISGQLRDGDGPFVLIPMIAAGQDQGRASTIFNHGNRYLLNSPGIVVRRLRDVNMPKLFAVSLQIHREEGGGAMS